jgi:hypothetical protein
VIQITVVVLVVSIMTVILTVLVEVRLYDHIETVVSILVVLKAVMNLIEVPTLTGIEIVEAVMISLVIPVIEIAVYRDQLI